MQSRCQLCAVTSSQRRAAGCGGCVVTTAACSLPRPAGAPHPSGTAHDLQGPQSLCPITKPLQHIVKRSCSPSSPACTTPGGESTPKTPMGVQCCSRPVSLRQGQAHPSSWSGRELEPVALACPCRVISAWSYLGWVLAPGEECVPMGQVVCLSYGMLGRRAATAPFSAGISPGRIIQLCCLAFYYSSCFFPLSSVFCVCATL